MKDVSPLFRALKAASSHRGSLKVIWGQLIQKGHMRKKPEMHLISLGRARQVETLGCFMEPQTVGHFVKLGWGPTVLRSSERGRGLCPCGGWDALWDPVATLKPRVQKVVVKWGHLTGHKGSRDRARSLSHPQGGTKAGNHLFRD